MFGGELLVASHQLFTETILVARVNSYPLGQIGDVLSSPLHVEIEAVVTHLPSPSSTFSGRDGEACGPPARSSSTRPQFRQSSNHPRISVTRHLAVHRTDA